MPVRFKVRSVDRQVSLNYLKQEYPLIKIISSLKKLIEAHSERK